MQFPSLNKKKGLAKLIAERRLGWLTLQPYFGVLLDNPLYECYIHETKRGIEVGRTIPIPSASRPEPAPDIYTAIFESDQLEKSIQLAKQKLDGLTGISEDLIEGYFWEKDPVNCEDLSKFSRVHFKDDFTNQFDNEEGQFYCEDQRRNTEEQVQRMHDIVSHMSSINSLQEEQNQVAIKASRSESSTKPGHHVMTFEEFRNTVPNFHESLAKEVYEKYLEKENEGPGKESDILTYSEARKLIHDMDKDLAKIAYLRYKAFRKTFASEAGGN